MTSCEHVFKGLCHVIGRGLFTVTPIMCDGHWPRGSEDTGCLICYVTLQGHVIKAPCGFMGISSRLCITNPPSLMVMHNVEMEIYFF